MNGLADPQYEYSCYSQTGISIWELKRLVCRDVDGKTQEKLVIVHDIERMSPVILDIYSIHV